MRGCCRERGTAVDALKAHLVDLQMPGDLEVVDSLLERLDHGAIGPVEAMEQLLAAQVALRRQRRLQTALRTSRLPRVKVLDAFDFAFQPSIDRAQILSLYQLGFLNRKENVIFLGPAGLGKTHLAVSLAITAAERGKRVYYGTLANLVLSLVEAERQGRLRERLAILRQPSLLIVNEIGYVPVTSNGANLFFQLVNARDELNSTVLTSNESLKEWGDIFGDSVVVALLHRLLPRQHPGQLLPPPGISRSHPSPGSLNQPAARTATRVPGDSNHEPPNPGRARHFHRPKWDIFNRH